jgi:hypothetical protein
MCCAADLLAHNANKATTNKDVHRAENLITVFYLLQPAHFTFDLETGTDPGLRPQCRLDRQPRHLARSEHMAPGRTFSGTLQQWLFLPDFQPVTGKQKPR